MRSVWNGVGEQPRRPGIRHRVHTGQLEPLKVDLDAVEGANYAQPDMKPVRQSLRDIGITSVIDLLSRGRARRWI